MYGKWADPMGRLQGTNERPANRAGQTARDQAGQSGRKLAEIDGKMPAAGDGDEGKGCLQYHTTCWRGGGRDRGRH